MLAPTGVPNVTMYRHRSGTNVLPSGKVVRSSPNHLCHEEPMETLKCDWREEEFSCKEELSDHKAAGCLYARLAMWTATIHATQQN